MSTNQNPLETKLLSHVLHAGSARKAMAQGIHEGWFSDPLCQAAWTEVTNHASRPATLGQTPSMKRVLKKVPGLELYEEPPEDTLDEIVLDMRETRTRAMIQQGLIHVDDLLRTFGPDAAADHLASLARELTSNVMMPSHLECDLVDAIPDFMKAYEKIEQGGGINGIPFPWDPLNDATGGMTPGTFSVIYAPSKAGKTWIGLECGVICPFEQANARCLVVSNEMPINQIYRRILARFCRVDYGGVVRGNLPLDARDGVFDALSGLQSEQMEQMQKAIQSNQYRDIRVMKPSARHGGGVNAIRAAIDKFEPDVVLVDGIYLMADDRAQGRRDNSWRSVANITQDLKGLASEYNIPVLGTTQANREGTKRKAGQDMDSYNDIGFGLSTIQDADLVVRLQKMKNATGDERILVTLPATRESRIDAFTLRFKPVIDFQLDQINVTPEDVAQMMVEGDDGASEPPITRNRQTRVESGGQAFSFGGGDPFK